MGFFVNNMDFRIRDQSKLRQYFIHRNGAIHSSDERRPNLDLTLKLVTGELGNHSKNLGLT